MDLKGYRVVADSFIPELKEAHRQERKWAHRVMYQRYRRFDFTYTRVVMVTGDTLLAHPNTVEQLMRQAK